MDQWILTLLTFIPVIGAGVILLLPGKAVDAIRLSLIHISEPTRPY